MKSIMKWVDFTIEKIETLVRKRADPDQKTEKRERRTKKNIERVWLEEHEQKEDGSKPETHQNRCQSAQKTECLKKPQTRTTVIEVVDRVFEAMVTGLCRLKGSSKEACQTEQG
ncbi:hypothetical protein RJT34_00344 [Clitoria ternatea]|uniref:Uncharacterized protein n=1 Tax=Clitoria ternatea TaxID=43366 RepID=A0AAN9KI73_CLITE